MSVPYSGDAMTSHFQSVTIRNERGQEMLDAVRPRLEIKPAVSKVAAARDAIM